VVKEIKEQIPAPTTTQTNTPINKELKKEWAKCQKNVQQFEEQLKLIKENMSSLEQQLSDPATYSDREKFLQAESAYALAQKEFEKVNAGYESAFEKMMEMEERLNGSV